jgi:hypothetical protein
LLPILSRRSAGPLTIDAQVTHVSQALLQLVISARRTSDTVRIVPSPSPVRNRAHGGTRRYPERK